MSLSQLSSSEMRVLEQLAYGHSYKEVAEKLYLSKDTVHSHAYKIRKKLGARSSVDLARIFILSFESPRERFADTVRKYSLVIAFMILQGYTMFTAPDMAIRVPGRTRVQTCRVIRKSKD